MNIENEHYSVRVSDDHSTISFIGTLRLQGREQYQKINDMLLAAAGEARSTLTLDFRELQFLNSSGISTLSLFIIEMRKRCVPIRIIGSRETSWQSKSLYNFQRLYDKVKIDIE